MNEKSMDSEIERAEQMVAMNLAKFETAMERLEQRIEMSRTNINRSLDAAKRPFLTAISYGNKAVEMGKSTTKKAKEDPKPFLIGAAVLLGSVALIARLRRRVA